MPIRRDLSPAVAEMLERDGVLDELLDGGGLRFQAAGPPPPPPGPPFEFGPFDSSSFIQPVKEPAPPVHREDEEVRPARPAKATGATPRLDEARRWTAAQVVADPRGAA